MKDKIRRVIIISKKADDKLREELKRRKAKAPLGQRNLKVSQMVDDLIVKHL